MLILSRNVMQEIKIGDDITIALVDIQGKQAKIGISAPKHIEVHRHEIYEKVQEERKAANKAKTLIFKKKLNLWPLKSKAEVK